jgi:hypothetical protein
MGVTRCVHSLPDQFVLAQRWHVVKLDDLMRMHNLAGAVSDNDGAVSRGSHSFHGVT